MHVMSDDCDMSLLLVTDFCWELNRAGGEWMLYGQACLYATVSN